MALSTRAAGTMKQSCGRASRIALTALLFRSSIYLECKGKRPVFKSGPDSNFFLVVILGYPDTGRDQSQARVIVSVVDKTDLALDFALGNDSNVRILLGIECSVVSRDSESDTGLVKKTDERSKHDIVIVVVVVLKVFVQLLGCLVAWMVDW